MYSQREKATRLSLITLGVALLLGIFAITKSSYLFFLFALTSIAISLIADAITLHILFRKSEGLLQLIRGSLLLFIVFILFLRMLKGL